MDLDELTGEVKNWLDITWDDPETEKKVKKIVSDGMFYLNEKAGEVLDYSSPGYGRQLLFEYARYARDGALDVFENNYRSLILAMQNDRRMKRAESSLPAGQ